MTVYGAVFILKLSSSSLLFFKCMHRSACTCWSRGQEPSFCTMTSCRCSPGRQVEKKNPFPPGSETAIFEHNIMLKFF